MTLQTIPLPGGETLAPITLYGANRAPEVTAMHRRVMVDHFGVPVNYLACPFPGVSHGGMMNEVLRATAAVPPTYYWFLDNDCVAMQRRAMDLMVASVLNGITVWGHAWQSSHKVGPNGTPQHAYASQACLCFPTALYRALGSPDCDHFNPRSDTAEEITYEAQLRGYQVALLYPSHSDTHTTALDNGCTYGRGNVYGPNLWYHESRADLEGHVERFVARCERVLVGEFEPC